MELSPRARLAIAVNAVVAWLGVVLTVVLSAVGAYREVPVDPGMYGDTGDGLAGAVTKYSPQWRINDVHKKENRGAVGRSGVVLRAECFSDGGAEEPLWPR